MNPNEQELRDEYCKAIGMLVVAFNDLEVELKWNSTFLLPHFEISDDIEEIRSLSRLLMGHLSFFQVLDMYKTLLKRFFDETEHKTITSHVKKLDDIRERRNFFVHANFAVRRITTGPPVLLKYQRFREEFRMEDVDVAAIYELIADIRDAANECQTFCSKAIMLK